MAQVWTLKKDLRDLENMACDSGVTIQLLGDNKWTVFGTTSN
jgi:hypothetical protein